MVGELSDRRRETDVGTGLSQWGRNARGRVPNSEELNMEITIVEWKR